VKPRIVDAIHEHHEARQQRPKYHAGDHVSRDLDRALATLLHIVLLTSVHSTTQGDAQFTTMVGNLWAFEADRSEEAAPGLHSGALLRRDSFGPLVCFRPDGPLLDDGVAHAATMQRRPIDQEERFTSRLHPVDERIGLLSRVDQWLQEYSHKFLPIEVRVVYYLFA
jgi:hypothetical protein